MIEAEWNNKEGYVRVEKRVNFTETKPVVKEIVVRTGKMRSCHPFSEDLLQFFIKKLKEEE